jgi:hypothetical protein
VSYLFLLDRDVDRPVLAAALAEMLGVAVAAVDVGSDDDYDRNWNAQVSCTVTSLDGDLPLHLDIYFADKLPSPPEAEAAAWLSARLGILVAYQSMPMPPSAYWLVGPDGRPARARLLDEDENGGLLVSGKRIAAAEAFISLYPEIPVTPLPEVIREFRMPTPLSDRLAAENQSPPGSPAWIAFDRLSSWESMVTRLIEGWLPDGWYPPEFYREDLETRDRLEKAAEALPETARSEFAEALAMIDHRFSEATVDDNGQALASRAGAVPDRWWWRRVTIPVPWQDMPGVTSR